MKKLLILLAGLAIIAMVAVPAIVMQPEERVNSIAQSVNAADDVNTTAVLSQFTAAPAQAPAGTEMLLDCADADMAITILDGYTLQEVTSDAYHKGSKYVFVNQQIGVTFSVHGTLEDAKSQSKILNTVRGDKNNTVVYDHTQIGDFSYLIHHASDCNWIWSICMLTDSGFSYRFWYEFPVNQGQDAIPQDALAMLSSIRLMEKAPIAMQGVTNELEVDTANAAYVQEKEGYRIYRILFTVFSDPETHTDLLSDNTYQSITSQIEAEGFTLFSDANDQASLYTYDVSRKLLEMEWGSYYSWTLEQKHKFDELMVSAKQIPYCFNLLPDDTELSQEAALSLALQAISERYGVMVDVTKAPESVVFSYYLADAKTQNAMWRIGVTDQGAAYTVHLLNGKVVLCKQERIL